MNRVRSGGISGRGLAYAVLVVAALLVPAIYLVSQANAPEQVTGFVTGVRTRAPLGVESFDLGAGDGRHLVFEVGPLDLSTGFDAAHLVTHQLTLQLVTVTYRRAGDRLIAIRLADGPVAALPSPGPSGSG